jgi:hypothetical protein
MRSICAHRLTREADLDAGNEKGKCETWGRWGMRAECGPASLAAFKVSCISLKETNERGHMYVA